MKALEKYGLSCTQYTILYTHTYKYYIDRYGNVIYMMQYRGTNVLYMMLCVYKYLMYNNYLLH